MSVHFVNNVLAAIASYVEEDPDTARDALAELGAFLTHRLRPPRAVSVQEEVDHVAVYLRLQALRFPGRLATQMPSGTLPEALLGPGDLQRPVGAALDGWLARRPGRVRLRLDSAGSGLELRLDSPDAPEDPPETVFIDLLPTARSSV